MHLLSDTQIQHFKEHGYLIIPNFITAMSELQTLRERIRTIVQESAEHLDTAATNHNEYFLESANKISCFTTGNQEGRHIHKVAHGLADHDPVFQQFTYRQEVYDIIQQLTEFEDVSVAQSMYLFKRALDGRIVMPHRDGCYLLTHKHPIIGFWFALEDATVDNACLYGVPGSHTRGISYEWIRSSSDNTTNRMQYKNILEDAYLEQYKYIDETAEYIPLEAKAGTVIIMHGHFLHKSGTNLSEQSREAYTVHFCDKTDFDREKNWIQKPFTSIIYHQ
jgi:phytanoyl-CoA hydroxylase